MNRRVELSCATFILSAIEVYICYLAVIVRCCTNASSNIFQIPLLDPMVGALTLYAALGAEGWIYCVGGSAHWRVRHFYPAFDSWRGPNPSEPECPNGRVETDGGPPTRQGRFGLFVFLYRDSICVGYSGSRRVASESRQLTSTSRHAVQIDLPEVEGPRVIGLSISSGATSRANCVMVFCSYRNKYGDSGFARMTSH